MNVLQRLLTQLSDWLFGQDTQPIPETDSMIKVLFVLKYREAYDHNETYSDSYSYSHGMSSGLLNSALMVNDMFNSLGLHHQKVNSKVVQVLDNNQIDKEVFAFKPDVVIIEAIWVAPTKFAELLPLHPTVKWIIRSHSNIPFLAQEGHALGWLAQYLTYKNVYVASNTPGSVGDLKELAAQVVGGGAEKVLYFPNYYLSLVEPTWEYRNGDELHVGCFGAIRPLKNQLAQALAAIRYAKRYGKKLFFHINGGRVETGGNPVLKNLRALFTGHPDAVLVEHGWMPHDDFVRFLGTMDVSMQVSFSETFNIVTADAVHAGCPVVVSSQISWVDERYQADPTDTRDIVCALERAIGDARDFGQDTNSFGLDEYNENSRHAIGFAIRDALHEIDTFGQ